MRAHLLLRLAASVLLLAGCSGSKSPTTPGTPRPVTYVGMGASDAVGVGALPLSRGYVFDLRDRMANAGFTVAFHNLGISGAKTDGIAAGSLEAAIAADPDVVTVWAGPNDLVAGRAPELFAAQLDGLLGALRARTGALVFVGDLPDLTQAPLFRFQPDPDVSAARIAAFNQQIQAIAAARGCFLVRLSGLSTDASMFFIDGFHPSNTGHRGIADLYWAEISPRL